MQLDVAGIAVCRLLNVKRWHKKHAHLQKDGMIRQAGAIHNMLIAWVGRVEIIS